jgi:hypothetical protein
VEDLAGDGREDGVDKKKMRTCYSCGHLTSYIICRRCGAPKKEKKVVLPTSDFKKIVEDRRKKLENDIENMMAEASAEFTGERVDFFIHKPNGKPYLCVFYKDK